MTPAAKTPLVEDLNRDKDEFWWIHPALRAKQSLSVPQVGTMPEGSHLWVRSDDPPPPSTRESDACMPVGQGAYADFAKVLYKLNGYRPGPVRGWYVVVCVEPGKAWAVGQLRADTQQPLQLFSDLVFETEDAARATADALRLKDPAPVRLPGEAIMGPSIQRKTAEAVELERRYRARLAGFARQRPTDESARQEASAFKKEQDIDPASDRGERARPRATIDQEEGE
ncbi:MAG: hypothetical protein Kilf2KO_41660 [Rhodospirillales bacterium]